MKLYSLEEIKDRHIGKRGTPEREEFEFNLQMELMGLMIKKLRKERNLTQSELGELIGVKKAQIAKLEKGNNNTSIQTLIRVFEALNVKAKFMVEFDKNDKAFEIKNLEEELVS
jgi:transcriptional regulator with XRE-family HTH domain